MQKVFGPVVVLATTLANVLHASPATTFFTTHHESPVCAFSHWFSCKSSGSSLFLDSSRISLRIPKEIPSSCSPFRTRKHVYGGRLKSKPDGFLNDGIENEIQDSCKRNNRSNKKERHETDNPTKRLASGYANRRDVLSGAASTALLSAASTFLGTPETSNAFPLDNVFSGSSSSSAINTQYVPAKRATAYLVDSTIPPTLVPFRASREAAILKNLGSGLGSPKTPQIDEKINLNNIMKKTVDGGLSAVGLSTAVKKRPKGLGAASFVFLGLNYNEGERGAADSTLAVALLEDMLKPRSGMASALGLASVPQSAQFLLDDCLSGKARMEDLVTYLDEKAGVPRSVSQSYLPPLVQFAKEKRLPLVALAPEAVDLRVVREEGLQNVDLARRSQYVADAQGFIDMTQNPKFKLYTDHSMMKDFTPKGEEDSPADFFAERILYDEAVATAAAQWAILRPDSLMAVIAPFESVRFMGGANARVERVCKFLSPDSSVDEESVTTILLNPSAKETLSQSRFLRLEIGTAPDNMDYQTKVADYLWFDTMPKVNMLPRLMNY